MEKSIKFFSLKFLLSVFGTIIIATAILLLRFVNLGIDPATSANIAISNRINISLGNYHLIFNIILLVIFYSINRNFFCLGTIINMTIPGYIIDFLQNKINNMHLHVSMFGEKLLIFL